MKAIIKKYLYMIVGLILLVLGMIFLSWFYEDIIYFFGKGVQLGRFIGVISTIYFGIFYLYKGFTNKMNLWSDASLIILLMTLLSYFILIFLGCYNIGGPCPSYTKITSAMGYPVLFLGGIISFLLSIVSLIKRRNNRK